VVIVDQAPATTLRLSSYRAADGASLTRAALILLVGLTTWGAKSTLIAMVALHLFPVWASLRVWARLGELHPAVN
jgi:hypothetical protein